MSYTETPSVEVQEQEERASQYEAPAVIYEGTIGTRAGSPTGGGDIFGSDPSSIFD